MLLFLKDIQCQSMTDGVPLCVFLSRYFLIHWQCIWDQGENKALKPYKVLYDWEQSRDIFCVFSLKSFRKQIVLKSTNGSEHVCLTGLTLSPLSGPWSQKLDNHQIIMKKMVITSSQSKSLCLALSEQCSLICRDVKQKPENTKSNESLIVSTLLWNKIRCVLYSSSSSKTDAPPF